MHRMTKSDNNVIPAFAMKNKFHCEEHEQIRRAVRAWAHNISNQDVVANMIITEWFRQDGKSLTWPESWTNRRQKFFRWIDADSPKARENIQRMKSAILTVLPIAYRRFIFGGPNAIRVALADSMAACSEAHRTFVMAGTNQQKIEAIADAIASLLDLSGDLEHEVREKVVDLRNKR